MWRGSRHNARTPRTPARTRNNFSARSKLTHSKVAQRRIKIRLLYASLLVVMLVSLLGGLSWLSFSEFLAIRHIKIQGNQDVSTRAIQAEILLETTTPKLQLFSQQNIILLPRKILEEHLAYTFPKVKEISVDTNVFTKIINVAVSEREPYGVWCDGHESAERCFLFDDTGFLFDSASTTLEVPNLVVFRGGMESDNNSVIRMFLSPKYFESVAHLLAQLSAQGHTPITFIFDGDDGHIVFAQGWELRVALDKDLNAAVFNLNAILERDELREQLEDMRYIDLRFDDRVYYKLRSDSEPDNIE